VGSRLHADAVSFRQAAINAGQAMAMLQIADGAMAKVNDILTRMKSLTVQAGSGQLSDTERSMLDTEYQALMSEVDRIADDTDFAGSSLIRGNQTVATYAAVNFQFNDGVEEINLRGDFGSYTNGQISYDQNEGAFSVTIGGDTYAGTMDEDAHDGTWMTDRTVVILSSDTSTNKIDMVIGYNYWMGFAHGSGYLNFFETDTKDFTFKLGTDGFQSADEDISVTLNSLDTDDLGIGSTSVATSADADTASVAVNQALDNLQGYRATVGATQNRVEFAAANIATALENTEAARSQILDLDVATEMTNFVSRQILAQSGASMLAQANQLPRNLLQLFR
jgi:flagellin